MFGAIIFGSIFVLAGAIMLVLSVNGYRDGQVTESWPSTTGRILSSSVQNDVDTSRDSNGRMRTRTRYEPVVQYEYEIDGRTYQGYRIKAGDYGGAAQRAYAVVNRYPVGAHVSVYHDPADPGQAVLEQGADKTTLYLFGGIGVLFSIIGLGALLFAGVQSRRVTGRAFDLTPGVTGLP